MDPAQLTPDWLARALERRGILGAAAVIAVHERARELGPFSARVRYEVEYSGVGRRALPERLFLKLSLPDTAASREMIATEGRFYLAYGADPALPLVRCVDAAHSPDVGASHLLLEDLSATHTNVPAPLPPTREQAEAMCSALARFHARWWEHPGLGTEIGEPWSERAAAESATSLEASLATFRGIVGDRMAASRYAVYERALSVWPQLTRRLRGPAKLTLIHGDAHAGNCLVPRDPARHPAYLADLATCRIRTPANDLAFMMAVSWFPSLRSRWEGALLRHHHEELVARGVTGYPLSDLEWDYRFAVIIHLFTPVIQAAGGIVGPGTWWYNAERIHAAFDDLNCAELW